MVSSLSGSRVFPVLYFIINNINNMSNKDLIEFLISLSYNRCDDDNFPLVYEGVYQYSFTRRCFKLDIGSELSSRCVCHIYKVVIHNIDTCGIELGPKCIYGKCFTVEYHSIVGVFY